MLYGHAAVSLEVRQAGDDSIIAGMFPYNVETELGAGRFEVFESRALQPGGNVYLLSQHDPQKPLASTGADSLTLTNTDDGLHFEARIAPAVADTSHGKDMLALIQSGLAVGLSPGFTVSPKGERVTQQGNGICRQINQAQLSELSIVTYPAYPTAQVEARDWRPDSGIQMFILPAAYRWR